MIRHRKPSNRHAITRTFSRIVMNGSAMMVTSRPIAGASTIAITHVGSGTVNGLLGQTEVTALIDSLGARDFWHRSDSFDFSAGKQEREGMTNRGDEAIGDVQLTWAGVAA